MGALPSSIVLMLATLGFNPIDDVAFDRVDLIELNHFYDERGRLVFDQIIFYDWSPAQSRYNVRDWRLLKSPAQIPHRSRQGGGFVAVWHDSHDGDMLREVHADALRESWTQYDPELVNRAFLPKEHRRELHKLMLKAGR